MDHYDEIHQLDEMHHLNDIWYHDKDIKLFALNKSKHLLSDISPKLILKKKYILVSNNLMVSNLGGQIHLHILFYGV